MEIPVINRIGDFEAGINPLQNPSILSQSFGLAGFGKVHEAYSFWKWGALILALLASFTTIINKIKILILTVRRNVDRSLPSLQPLLADDDDYDSETDFSCSSSDDEEEEEEEEVEGEDGEYEVSTSTSSKWRHINEDNKPRGSDHYDGDELHNGKFGLRRRRRSSGSFGDLFSWSELASGKSVVKLWDNLGLGFRLDNVDEGQDVASFIGEKRGVIYPRVSGSPAVVVAAGQNQSGRVALSAWDTRSRCRIPAVLGEWRPNLGRIAGVNVDGGGVKVYVRDDVSGGLKVGDMRKVASPLADLTESADVDTWWDADAVIVTEESM